MKYYGFKLSRRVNTAEVQMLLVSSFNTKFSISWLSEDICYLFSENNISYSLNELLPVLESELGCQITIIISHCFDSFTEMALQKAAWQSQGRCLNLFEVVLAGIVSDDKQLTAAFRRYFLHVPKELLVTMSAYLSSNTSGTETAENLYIHRNTWIYRMNRFQSLTGLDLHDFDDVCFLRLWLAYNRVS